MEQNLIEDERKELAILARKLSTPPEYDEFATSTKDSSLKRVTSLIRRLKNIPNEALPQLLKDVQQVNLAMHYSEVCSSILENRPKNSAEYLSIVTTILHLLIESDLELRNMLYREILRNVSNLMQTGLSPSDKSNFSSFRYFYRLSCELQIIKATDNKLNSLSVALKNLLTQEEEKAAEFIPFAVYLLKNLKGYLLPTFEGDQLFEKTYAAIVDFFKTMCRFSLRLLGKYKGTEFKARAFYEQKADLSLEFEANLISSYEEFKALKTALAVFAELILLPLPNYENSEPQFIIDDKKVIFTSKIEIEADIYQDEEERDFYEKFPENNSAEDEVFSLPEEWKTCEEIEEISKEIVDPEAIATKERLPKGMQQFFKQVEGILSVNDVDILSEKINSVGKELRIEPYFETFFEIARRKPELVRYISRIMAMIKRTHPKLVQSMIQSMCGQFHFLTKMKEPILRTRRRICSFVSEFTKFKLLPQSIAYNCLKKCLLDFSGTSVDMTCFLLEQSGRFLYLQPESHARMKHLITKIVNFRKNSFNNPNDKNILLGYAIYCVTKTQAVNFILEPDLMETFFTFAFGRLECPQDFVKLIQSVDLESDLKTLQLLITETAGLEPSNFDNLTVALVSLKDSHSEFVCKIVDLVLCQSISDIKNFDQFNFQVALKRAQLIGKFYCRKLIDSSVFFGYLYQCITIGHAIGLTDEEDGPENMARSRLILTLLSSLRESRFDPGFYFYLHEFMAMFRCYLSFKLELSKEIYELACDVYKAFDDAPFEPLQLNLALKNFTSYAVHNLFLGKLDYLKVKSQKTTESDNAAALKAQKAEKMAQELQELDKEMSKIIGHDLESRKLDLMQAQSSDVYLPYSGLLQRSSSSSFNGTTPSILLKKKKKSVLKTLNK